MSTVLPDEESLADPVLDELLEHPAAVRAATATIASAGASFRTFKIGSPCPFLTEAKKRQLPQMMRYPQRAVHRAAATRRACVADVIDGRCLVALHVATKELPARMER